MKAMHVLLAAAALTCSLLPVSALTQQPAPAQAAPIPPAILSAKKLFLSNGGPGLALPKRDPNETFNRFYAALKASNQFELGSDPADADLVLELRVPIVETVGINMVLTIYDRKSHYVLWTMSESSTPCTLISTCERNMAAAPAALVGDFLVLAGKAPASSH